MKRSGRKVHVDMTPMVDVAFLLLTFFMLTTTFRSDGALPVQLPASRSVREMPEAPELMVTVGRDGGVVVTLPGESVRERFFSTVIAGSLKQQGIGGQAVADSLQLFRKHGSFTAPAGQLTGMVAAARPCFSQQPAPVIKADRLTPFCEIRPVITALRQAGFDTFNLATVAEQHGR